jgi:hypothetical protein
MPDLRAGGRTPAEEVTFQFTACLTYITHHHHHLSAITIAVIILSVFIVCVAGLQIMYHMGTTVDF